MRNNKYSKNSRDGGEEKEGNPESDHQVARMPHNPERQQGSSGKRKRRSSGGSNHRRRSRKSENRKVGAEPDDSNSNSNSNNNNNNLVDRYRAILDGNDGSSEEFNKASNVLEAAAGNVSMAAQLYWDDYFASQAAAAPMEQESKLPVARHREESSSDDDDDDEDDSQDGFAQHPHRKLRRSLDGAFGRAASEPKSNDDNNMQQDDDDDDDDDEDMSDHAPEEDINAPEAALEHDNNINNNNVVPGSVSVSDDEGAGNGVWRIMGNMVARLEDTSTRRRADDDMERRIKEAAAAVARKVSHKIDADSSKRKRKQLRKYSTIEEEDTDYISDSDWLQEHDEDGGTIRDPLESLWGKGRTADAETENANPPPPAEENAAEGNVVADEEAEDKPKSKASGIPHTWLSASFALAEGAGGLALKPPKPEDIDFFTWRQQQNNHRRGVPPPHHCKAITAVLAILNAMFLTGASIQGNQVNCTKAQKPLAQLSEVERKQQFEERLTDALAGLIFVAAKASRTRKQRAMAKAKEGQTKDDDQDDDDDDSANDQVQKGELEMKCQKMKRRLNLIPTCTWADDPTASMPQALDGPSHQNVQLRSSLTNIQDIRLHVLSCIREFMAPGGVALLLEIILRIHGPGVIARMMERAKKEGSSTAPSSTSLISCTCEQRQSEMLEKNPLPPSARNDPSKLIDTTPPGNECISKEMMSLLLTGRVESSWKGWSTGGLEFGILSNVPGEVGWQLARPAQPVWILQGETSYSVLNLDDCIGADRKTISELDIPGAVLEFAHWNCWYGQRNKSGLRLTTAVGKWNPPGVASTKQGIWDGCRGPMESRDTVELLKQRLGHKKSNMLSATEQESIEAKEKEASIRPEELEAVKTHPEDERFYPGKHTMWRFDMGKAEKENLAEGENGKPRADNWVPYHRLSARHQKIVELKLGPKIRAILWTRWPNAKIDNFSPANEDPPIV